MNRLEYRHRNNAARERFARTKFQCPSYDAQRLVPLAVVVDLNFNIAQSILELHYYKFEQSNFEISSKSGYWILRPYRVDAFQVLNLHRNSEQKV